MFSDNNKISERQIFRLLTYDLLGIGALLLPPVLGRAAGRDGIFCIFFGVSAGLLYLGMLRGILRDMKGNFCDYLKDYFGVLGSRIVMLGCLIYFALLAGYTAYLFSDIVLRHLLREESFHLVLALLLALVFYGMWEGLEGRARVYEILFWLILIPLVLMLFSALNEIETDYWAPVFTSDVFGVLEGSYYVFLPLALVFLLLFLSGYTEKREVLFFAGRRAVLWTGSIYAVLYLILVGIFGADALGTMEYPAVTLMSTVKISGGFLKRTDAFMFGIWFFTLYALLGSSVFYGALALRSLTGTEQFYNEQRNRKRERSSAAVILLAVFVIAEILYRSAGACKDYESFLWYIGTPFLVFVPILLTLCRIWKNRRDGAEGKREEDKRKEEKNQEEKKQEEKKQEEKKQEKKKLEKETKNRQGRMGILLLLILGSSVCGGCGTAELEERNFPIELAVKNTDSFAAEWLNANESGSRVIDYNHLKVLILEETFVEDEVKMQEFLDFFEEKSEVPRNTYVVAAEEPEKIIKLQGEKGESVGYYLEELFENVSEVKKKMYPTLGMMYQEQENQLETLLIPIVGEKDGKPAVEDYYAWKRGQAAGRVDSETTLLSFFTQNGMDSYTVSLDMGTVRLTEAHNEIHFKENSLAEKPGEKDKEILADVYCNGEVLYRKNEAENRQIEREIEDAMNDWADRALERGIDVTNSYRKLGGFMRDWYFWYAEEPARFEEDVYIVYRVHITWINL